jgi:hypothetical protein
MWIVGADELLNRRRFGEQIADGDAPALGLRARESDCHAARRYGIGTDDDERAVAIERFAEFLAGCLPVERAPNGRGGHGEPTMT